jgi:hypothetical protein
MQDRLKILDCSRKNVLSLPDAAFHLWFCYYMNEDGERESFMSLDTIEEQMDMRMSRRSIITWTKWLLARGWLVDTGKTAADKWLALGKIPTRGAYQIRVYRADDPTGGNSAPVNTPENVENFTSANSAPVQIAHKVYLYDSGSGLGSGSTSLSTSVRVTPLRGLDDPNLLKPEPKPQTKTKTKTNGSRSLAPDGTPWPTWDAHDQTWKTARLIELGHTKPVVGKSVPREEEAKPLGHGAGCDDLDCTACLDGIGSCSGTPSYDQARPGVTTSVAKQKQKEKLTGLAAFLAEGNPIRISESNYSLDDLGDDPNFVPRCAYKHGTKRCWNAGESDGYCSEHAHLEV